MKIYTKKGDQGQTSLVDGASVNKSDPRLETYGTVDELNSHVGLLVSLLQKEASLSPEVKDLQDIQRWLFQLGSQLACEDQDVAKKLPTIHQEQIQFLEDRMDQLSKELPPLKNFILPGGHLSSSQAHICRTVSRRAERNCVFLDQQKPLNYPGIPFLNRLSDYFFVLARVVNHRLGVQSLEWIAN